MAEGITFPMAITPHLVAVSLVWALCIAIVGGILLRLQASTDGRHFSFPASH